MIQFILTAQREDEGKREPEKCIFSKRSLEKFWKKKTKTDFGK